MLAIMLGISGAVIVGLLVALLLTMRQLKVQMGNVQGKVIEGTLNAAALSDAEHIFDDQFREELRNRGRLHFENIIHENAMFLQQDLRLTTSQLHDYLKDEMRKVLDKEFASYVSSIDALKENVVQAMEKTQSAIEEQRTLYEARLVAEIAKEKDRLIATFDQRMSSIVTHYLLDALRDELDVADQLDFILQHLEADKQAIVEDIKHGA